MTGLALADFHFYKCKETTLGGYKMRINLTVCIALMLTVAGGSALAENVKKQL